MLKSITMLKQASQIPVKGNCNPTSYKENLDNCVFSTLWNPLREGPHRGVMVRCPCTFGYILYI